MPSYLLGIWILQCCTLLKLTSRFYVEVIQAAVRPPITSATAAMLRALSHLSGPHGGRTADLQRNFILEVTGHHNTTVSRQH